MIRAPNLFSSACFSPGVPVRPLMDLECTDLSLGTPRTHIMEGCLNIGMCFCHCKGWVPEKIITFGFSLQQDRLDIVSWEWRFKGSTLVTSHP